MWEMRVTENPTLSYASLKENKYRNLDINFILSDKKWWKKKKKTDRTWSCHKRQIYSIRVENKKQENRLNWKDNKNPYKA